MIWIIPLATTTSEKPFKKQVSLNVNKIKDSIKITTAKPQNFKILKIQNFLLID
jgi:hypothetical protein